MRRLLSICMVFLLSLCAGCGIPPERAKDSAGRIVTDGMGSQVTVPLHAERIVSVGVSTDDVLLAALGSERVIGISELPPNMPEAAAKVKHRITGAAESVIALHPDLVIAPDWKQAEYVDAIRSAGIPVYVYRMPRTAEGMIDMIHELCHAAGGEDGGNTLADETKARMSHLAAFAKSIPAEQKMKTDFCRSNGIGGGKGSIFDGLCEGSGLINGSAAIGLEGNQSAGREALLRIQPDIIFVPSDAYSQNDNNAKEMNQILSDPAMADVPAVKHRRVYMIDARWLMSYSQFMVNAMEEMAHDAYGYEVKPAA